MYIFSTLNFFADSESYSGLVYQCLFRSDQSALKISSSLSLLTSTGGPSPQGKSILMSTTQYTTGYNKLYYRL